MSRPYLARSFVSQVGRAARGRREEASTVGRKSPTIPYHRTTKDRGFFSHAMLLKHETVAFACTEGVDLDTTLVA